ncbi:hypothetical protein PMAYCL1PPCAC_15343, partial [Pristionchus mayeri]
DPRTRRDSHIPNGHIVDRHSLDVHSENIREPLKFQCTGASEWHLHLVCHHGQSIHSNNGVNLTTQFLLDVSMLRHNQHGP